MRGQGLRILHVPYSYYPDPPGGTEIYVEGLAEWQRTLGCDVAVAAPGERADRYERAGYPVWRFAVSKNLGLRELYGEGDLAAAEAFGAIMDSFHPDVVHLHAMTSAVSVALAAQISRRRVPFVFNFHTPTVSCIRGTLVRGGTEICDGLLDHGTCTACVLQGKGVSGTLASLLTRLPISASRAIGDAGFSGGLWTALRMPELVALRIQMFRRMMDQAERVVALCDWTRELLLLNDVPPAKVSLCRQGINWDSRESAGGTNAKGQVPLRFAFLGRLDSTKGVHVIVEAMRRGLPAELDLYCVRQGDPGNQYATQVRNLIGDDPRIRLLPPLSSASVVATLRNYDALLVPSQLLETGPLVVLEAFAAGTPVIGSGLGGIAELVTDEFDGLLIGSYSSPAAWTAAFERLCAKPELLGSLRSGIRPPRHSRQVALDMMPLYEALVRDRINSGPIA
jgi:glycosyltransferase involved in cell wall biosynthesis